MAPDRAMSCAAGFWLHLRMRRESFGIRSFHRPSTCPPISVAVAVALGSHRHLKAELEQPTYEQTIMTSSCYASSCT